MMYAWASQIEDVIYDSNGQHVLLKDTIFHPAVGGQPQDSGHISVKRVNLPIRSVSNTCDGHIAHTVDSDFDVTKLIGVNAAVHVNPTKRQINSAYHTVGHLLAQVVIERLEMYELTVTNFCHQPNAAFVEFDSNGKGISLSSFVKRVQCAANDERLANKKVTIKFNDSNYVNTAAKYASDENQSNRTVQIDGFQPIYCEGTHLTNLSLVQAIHSLKLKTNKSKIRLYYGCTVQPVYSF